MHLECEGQSEVTQLKPNMELRELLEHAKTVLGRADIDFDSEDLKKKKNLHLEQKEKFKFKVTSKVVICILILAMIPPPNLATWN